jgi:hypothetical protein
MLKNFLNKETSSLENELNRVHSEMSGVEVGSERYNALLTNFERLTRLQSEKKTFRVSPDTLAIVGANLLGILIIVGYERAHVIASRGMNVLLRTKHQ